MRLFFILILVLVFSFGVIAQLPADRQLFAEANTASRAGDHTSALQKYRAIDLFHKEAVFAAKVRYNIGVSLYQLGRVDEAVAEYAAAIDLNAKYQKAYYAMGMVQVALGNSQEAKFAFHAALKLNAADGEAWFDLGMVLLGEKNYDSAAGAFENAVLHQSANSADATNNIGVIVAMNGDIEKAKSKFKDAWAISNGKSREAIANFNICARYEQKTDWQFTAKLEFSKKYSGE